MNWTIKPLGNLSLAVCWAVAIALFASTGEYKGKLMMVVVGVLLGVTTGALQSRAMKQNAGDWIEASTALKVRSALRRSLAGRLAVYTNWIAAVLAFAVGFQYSTTIPYITSIAGYAVFMLSRDIITLPASISLIKAYEQTKSRSA